MFEKIRKWYILGLWTEKMVTDAHKRGVLTAQQTQEIIEEGRYNE